MQADLTRDNFDLHKHFIRVLMQQGRVQLDSDWNEQVAILLHYMQTLAADLIGPHGGPFSDKPGFETEPGFKIVLFTDQGNISDLCISYGRYYVDGLLCENEEVLRENEGGDAIGLVTYYNQPDYPLDKTREEDQLPGGFPFLVYLDVWERHITAIEDPRIREVALGVGGPDTATRAKLVWQVKTTSEAPEGCDYAFPATRDDVEACWNQWVEQWQPADRGKLQAKAKEDAGRDADPCIISPEARYRGVENQLYRVQIHKGGRAEGGGTPTATFKWSRDNGSVTFPIRDLDGETVTLEHLGRDSRLSLKVGDWVEIEDDDYVLRAEAKPLLQVEEIDRVGMRVRLSGEPSDDVGRYPRKHPLLRRWDHGAGDSEKGELEQNTGTLLVMEGTWIELEDGVQIYFQPATERRIIQYEIQDGDTLWDLAQYFGTTVEELLCLNPYIQDPDHIYMGNTLKVPSGTDGDTSAYHRYRSGDYWLIPARMATGDVEWPEDAGGPEARPPHGVEHHYAPLAVVVSAENCEYNPVDCRYKFRPLRECCPPQPAPPPPASAEVDSEQ